MTEQNQPYGAPYGAPHEDRPAQGGRGMAIAALILGILALLFSWTIVVGILAGLAALVLGVVAARKAKQGRAGGRVMAIVGAILGVVGLLIGAAILVGALALFNSESVQDLRTCLEDAGSDEAAIQQCQDDASRQLSN